MILWSSCECLCGERERVMNLLGEERKVAAGMGKRNKKKEGENIEIRGNGGEAVK